MTVLFETAVKLRDAGFRQPEPSQGQIWWRGKDWFVLISYNCEGSIGFYNDGISGSIEALGENPFAAFAPTAIDILQELGYNFSLSCLSDGTWFCDNQEDKTDAWQHENPAEACALAWLEVNKKCMVMTIPPATIIKCTGAIEIPENK
jgi:hypothetical protein